MGLVDNGGQILVFDYKQEGKSEGFNKILYNLIPKGIVKGGTLVKTSDASVIISPFLCFFEDATTKVGVRIETTMNATSDISISKPYIIGRFSWLNLEDNYMDIISVSSTEISSSDLILGRAIFDSTTLTGFDYSKKSWAKSYYDNDIDFEPSFLVSANEPYDNKLKVGKGSAYINGKKVVFGAEKQTPIFDLNVTNGRKDLVVINDDATVSIIKGTDDTVPVAPLFPVKGLVVAIVTLPPNPTSVNGRFVEYLYNNNFYSTQSNNIVASASVSPSPNTLMIRDGNGRSQVENPLEDNDIVNKTYVDTKIAGSVPKGFIYVQFPNQIDPNTLFGGTWQNISNLYAGQFFRAEGSGAASFGNSQAEGLPNIQGQATFYSGVSSRASFDNSFIMSVSGSFSSANITKGDVFVLSNKTPEKPSGKGILNFNASSSNSIYGRNSHVTPVNSTIRIWKRTA